jgi:hypothetical protein
LSANAEISRIHTALLDVLTRSWQPRSCTSRSYLAWTGPGSFNCISYCLLSINSAAVGGERDQSHMSSSPLIDECRRKTTRQTSETPTPIPPYLQAIGASAFHIRSNIALSLNMQTDDIRRRAACDRCHTQKTRCPKRPGEDVCDRCVKTQSPCVFSPFRQKKDPEGNPPESAVPNRQLASKSTGTRQKRKRLISPRPESTSMPDPPSPPQTSTSHV